LQWDPSAKSAAARLVRRRAATLEAAEGNSIQQRGVGKPRVRLHAHPPTTVSDGAGGIIAHRSTTPRTLPGRRARGWHASSASCLQGSGLVRDSIRTFCVREQCSVVKRRSPLFPYTLGLRILGGREQWETKGEGPVAIRRSLDHSLQILTCDSGWIQFALQIRTLSLGGRKRPQAGLFLPTHCIGRFYPLAAFGSPSMPSNTPHGKWVPRKTRRALVRRVQTNGNHVRVELEISLPGAAVCQKARALTSARADTTSSTHASSSVPCSCRGKSGGRTNWYRMLAFPVWKWQR